MMKKQIICLFGPLLLLASCSVYRQDLGIFPCPETPPASSAFSKAPALEAAMNTLVQKGIPGIAMAVYSSDEGWWEYAAGYAKIEDGTPMRSCRLHYLQSISKTYLAVGIMKLYEEGKIRLDDPLSACLPAELSRYITGAGRVTVRMLLNHTSGLPEYNYDPGYVTGLLQHPDKEFTPEDYLKIIDGKPLQFEPGTRYRYGNINYVILALIADHLTGDHARYLTDVIFRPLGLTHTFYRNEPGYLSYPLLYNAYWDRYGNGVVENVSRLQRQNVSNMIGDDGIVCAPRDAVLFLKGLMEGRILSPATLDTMKVWVHDSGGQARYGLGLAQATFRGEEAWGHSGGGIGAGCQLYYFPGRDIYFFAGINLGTVTDSPLHRAAGEALDQVYEALLKPGKSSGDPD